MSYILKLINKPLSDADIKQILGEDTKIIKYSYLSHFNDLDELLPKPIDFVVILFEESPSVGHWVSVSKYNGIFEFFDPYGNQPDATMSWINISQKRRLNELVPYLSNLLKNKNYIYNHIKYQEMDEYVNTCGSHTAHRLYRLKYDGMTLNDYYNFMKDIKYKNKVGFDIIVAEFVKEHLKSRE